jgi:cytochrome c biogenesis protein CcmG/thiol:disulfide interchange protein DsbE
VIAVRRLAAGVVLALVFGGVWAVNALVSRGDQVPQLGVVPTSEPLPSISGPFIQGDRYSASRVHGDVLVLNFWNPYCAPCRAEATALDLAFGRLHAGRAPVSFTGVLYSNDRFPHDVPAARRFARDLGEPYPTIDDADGRLADAFGIPGIPATVIADAAGRIRYKIFGPLKRGELEGLVRRLLPR